MTEDDKRILTEWLGEKYYSTYPLNQKNLDFTDGRVVMRLFEKLCAKITMLAACEYITEFDDLPPKEAICAACLAYIKEGGK